MLLCSNIFLGPNLSKATLFPLKGPGWAARDFQGLREGGLKRRGRGSDKGMKSRRASPSSWASRSDVSDLATPQTVACQAPLFTRFTKKPPRKLDCTHHTEENELASLPRLSAGPLDV